MSDVKRYNVAGEHVFDADQMCGGLDVILASDYDALAAENAKLRKALSRLVQTPAVIDACNPSSLQHEGDCRCPWCKAHDALATAVQPAASRTQKET